VPYRFGHVVRVFASFASDLSGLFSCLDTTRAHISVACSTGQHETARDVATVTTSMPAGDLELLTPDQLCELLQVKKSWLEPRRACER
jgi:hypothetical protein